VSVWAGSRRYFAACVVLACETRVARADDTQPGASKDPFIWYRTSEGCPDGAAFVARLRGPARGARLAGAGDPVDFVVTLGSHDGRSVGKLERQTQGSTIAVREIEAKSCEEVADVLALTLVLTLAPNAQGTTPATEPNPSPPAEGVETEAKTAERARAPTPPTSERKPPRRLPAAPVASRPTVWVGARGGAFAGFLGSPGASAGLFGEVTPHRFVLPSASARATLVGAFAQEPKAPRFTMLLLAVRLEASPADLIGGSFHLRPCVGVELGRLAVESESDEGRSDSAPWASATAALRPTWELGPHWAFEAELGAFLPFSPYRVRSEDPRDGRHRLGRIALSGSVGVAVGLP
jgi:hypothetical protein